MADETRFIYKCVGKQVIDSEGKKETRLCYGCGLSVPVSPNDEVAIIIPKKCLVPDIKSDLRGTKYKPKWEMIRKHAKKLMDTETLTVIHRPEDDALIEAEEKALAEDLAKREAEEKIKCEEHAAKLEKAITSVDLTPPPSGESEPNTMKILKERDEINNNIIIDINDVGDGKLFMSDFVSFKRLDQIANRKGIPLKDVEAFVEKYKDRLEESKGKYRFKLQDSNKIMSTNI